LRESISAEERAATLANIESMRKQRENTLKWVAAGEPLKAEFEEERKISYVQSRTSIKEIEKAAKVADYDESGYSGMSSIERHDAKTIVKDVEPYLVDVYFLEVAQAAAATVGRVVDNAEDAKGSGFMISKDLFITNNHVINDQSKAQALFVEFNYELDVMRTPKPITRFALDPTKFFMTSPKLPKGLDFTIVALGARVFGQGKLSDFGYCPLKGDIKNKHALGTLANIIQHPEGNFKQISIRKNLLAARNDEVLHYYTEAEKGSSGAPVFNYRWEPIALHRAGAPIQNAYTSDGQHGPIENVREGIRISAIVESISVAKTSLTKRECSLIDKALNCPFWHPSLIKTH